MSVVPPGVDDLDDDSPCVRTFFYSEAKAILFQRHL